MRAYAPNGNLIVSSKEIIPAAAMIRVDSFRKREDGSIGFEYLGETEKFYDDQTTITNAEGKVIFIDADGDEWSEDQLELRAE